MTVYLVGAGPGDPGLLTRRGAELLRAAEIVLYDRLAAAALLDRAEAVAERTEVAKTTGHPSEPHDEVNRLVV
jgi:siroheme synthase